jgi:hypothetical protein
MDGKWQKCKNVFTGVVSSFGRSAGVLTRSTRNANQMPNISITFLLPSAAAGTAALQKIANLDTAFEPPLQFFYKPLTRR